MLQQRWYQPPTLNENAWQEAAKVSSSDNTSHNIDDSVINVSLWFHLDSSLDSALFYLSSRLQKFNVIVNFICSFLCVSGQRLLKRGRKGKHSKQFMQINCVCFCRSAQKTAPVVKDLKLFSIVMMILTFFSFHSSPRSKPSELIFSSFSSLTPKIILIWFLSYEDNAIYVEINARDYGMKW